MEDWVKARLDKFESTLDRFEDKLISIDKTLTVNTNLLADHIKRTNILEEELKPISVQFRAIKVMFAFLVGFTGLAGAIATVIKALSR